MRIHLVQILHEVMIVVDRLQTHVDEVLILLILWGFQRGLLIRSPSRAFLFGAGFPLYIRKNLHFLQNSRFFEYNQSATV